MHRMYLDCMSICKFYGFPDLFITFTCNPKKPELTRYFEKYNLRSKDRPELYCRLFKVKLDKLMDDLTKKHLLGKTVSGAYFVSTLNIKSVFDFFLLFYLVFYHFAGLLLIILTWSWFILQLFILLSFKNEGFHMRIFCYSWIRQLSFQILMILIG